MQGVETYQMTTSDLFGEETIFRYQYEHPNGKYFKATGSTLQECRVQRNQWLKAYSVAFTGHRTPRILASAGNNKHILEMLTLRTRTHLHTLCVAGYHTYLCGMSEGFDLMAAEQVNILKTLFDGVRLIVVVPFRGQEACFSLNDQKRYYQILEEADETVILSDTYFEGCFTKRNDYLLKYAGRVLACFDGAFYGGTAYTVRKATMKGILIDNIF